MARTLTDDDVDAIAARLAELMKGAPATGEILTRTEARAYVKRPSEGAFHDWAKEWHVKPYHRGRYSRTQLDLALSREARKRG